MAPMRKNKSLLDELAASAGSDQLIATVMMGKKGNHSLAFLL